MTPPVELSDVTAEAYYKGDVYGNETGNLWVNFTEGLTYDAETDDYTGEGYILCLDFNTVLASNPDYATIADGEYTGSQDNETHAAYTLNLCDEESYLTEYTASGANTVFFTNATVNIKKTDNLYQIDASLTTESGDKKEYSYNVRIPVINISGEGMQSNMTSDATLNGLTQGIAIYYGETFTETSDLYTVILAGDDYNLETNYGNSPAIMLALNVTPGSSESIPDGTYTVIDAATADDYETGTVLSGVYEPTLGGLFGSWYFSTLEGLQASMMSGTVTVTNNGGKKYTFVYDLADGYGHKVTGTYSGSMSWASVE